MKRRRKKKKGDGESRLRKPVDAILTLHFRKKVHEGRKIRWTKKGRIALNVGRRSVTSRSPGGTTSKTASDVKSRRPGSAYIIQL